MDWFDWNKDSLLFLQRWRRFSIGLVFFCNQILISWWFAQINLACLLYSIRKIDKRSKSFRDQSKYLPSMKNTLGDDLIYLQTYKKKETQINLHSSSLRTRTNSTSSSFQGPSFLLAGCTTSRYWKHIHQFLMWQWSNPSRHNIA